MITEPTIVTKPAQPFAAVMLTLSQPEISDKAPHRIEEVIAWVKAKGGQLTGAPFFNYVGFWPDGRMDMQVGMPTDRVLEGDSTIATGTLPRGRYASLTATVPYHELHDANMQLDAWVHAQRLKLDGKVDGDRFVGANRMEIYHKDPGEDPSGHPVTEIAFRLAD